DVWDCVLEDEFHRSPFCASVSEPLLQSPSALTVRRPFASLSSLVYSRAEQSAVGRSRVDRASRRLIRFTATVPCFFGPEGAWQRCFSRFAPRPKSPPHRRRCATTSLPRCESSHDPRCL